MSTTLLKVKRSAVKGKTPAVGNVELGEIAINTNDGRLFFKRTDSAGNNSIKTLTEIVGGTGIENIEGTLNLSKTGVTAATYGSSTQIPVFSVNEQGQIDSATSRTVAGVSGVTFDSSEATINVSTADGGSFNARIGLSSFSTSDLSEGTNKYYTQARVETDAREAISVSGAGLAYNNSNGVITISETTYGGFDSDFTDKSTSDLSEGTNLYHTTARARAAISVTDAAGDGTLSYNASTGVITYNGITDAQVRGKLSGGTGITYTSGTGVIKTTDGDIVHDNLSGFVANEHIDHSGVTITAGTGLTGGGTIASTRTLNVIGGKGITVNANDIQVDSGNIKTIYTPGTGVGIDNGEVSIGQAVETDADVTFNDMTINGNLTITGSLTDIATTNLTVTDKNIIIADSATTSALTDGAGLTFGAWSSGTKPLFKWDHGNTRFDLNYPLKAGGSGFVGDIAGDVTGQVSDISNFTTADLTENTNLYHTTLRARGAISGTTSGTGFGGLSYNNTSGIMTFAKVTTANIRNQINVAGDLAYDSASGQLSFSETYSSAAELLTALKTVDTNSSGLNADTLDGEQGSHYRINVYNSSGSLLN